MRPLEIVAILVTTLWGASWIARRRDATFVLGLAAVLIIAAQALVEGSRFHLVPAYALAAVLAVAQIVRALRPLRPAVAPGRWRRAIGAAGLLIGFVIAAGLPSAFPVFSYDAPTGPYAIGTSTYTLPHAPAWSRHPEIARDLAVQVWYPADRSAAGSIAPMSARPDALASEYSKLTGLPQPLFDHLRLIRTHARLSVPVSPMMGRYPVVLFSPGFGAANRSQSIFQLEELASHGFVVVAIDHTGLTSPTIFPDGRVERLAPDVVWPTEVTEATTAEVDTFHADARFVLDQLAMLNAGDPSNLLTGRLDLARVGYLGASFGGSAATETLADDPRIQAVVAEDGKPYFHDDVPARLQRPVMYFQSAAPYIPSTDAQLAKWNLTSAVFRAAEQDHYARQMRQFTLAGGPYYNVFIRGADHVTFADLYLVINLPSARLDIRRAHRIINDYTTAFFDRYLNGVMSPLVDGSTPSPFPEVTVASRNVMPGGLTARR